jgi:DNA ligase (NAD+)
VELPYYLGSLDKIRDDPKALTKWLNTYTGSYVLSDKLDGISGLFVIYENGKRMLLTRGDGFFGQDVSLALDYIQGIPSIGTGTRLAVRGELILSKENWKKIQDTGANPRNVVSGAMNAAIKNPNKRVLSLIEFVAYESMEPKEAPGNGFQHLEKMGFKTPYYQILSPSSSASITSDFLSKTLMERREKSHYDIDGIVFMHNEKHKVIKGKNPKYGFAFKTLLTHDRAEVLVSSVEWKISKDGFIKPTVVFEPVVMDGVKIQRATGFNAQYIEKHKIGPGARIVIIRSGDVIPYILEVLHPSAVANMPPSSLKWKWNDNHVDAILEDADENEHVQLKKLEHFVSQLDIKNVGPGTLRKLFAHGIRTIPELVRVTIAQVRGIEGFKDKSAEKVVNSIHETVRRASITDLMVASAVFGRGLGKTKMEAILKIYPDLGRPAATIPAHPDEQRHVPGISHSTLQQVLDDIPTFHAFLKDIGITYQRVPSPPQVATSKWKDAVVVFTGFRNKELESQIETGGGKVSNTVTKKTTIVIAKEMDNSTKLQKAHELGIRIVLLKDL